jgi:hypothetical protein
MKKHLLIDSIAFLTTCPLAFGGLFATPVDNASFEAPVTANFGPITTGWASEGAGTFLQNEASAATMPITPYGAQWGGMTGVGAIYQQIGAFAENEDILVAWVAGDRSNKVWAGLTIELWAGGTGYAEGVDAATLSGTPLAGQGATLIGSHVMPLVETAGVQAVGQSVDFNTGASTVNYSPGDPLWIRIAGGTASAADQGFVDNVVVTSGGSALPPLYELTSSPHVMKMFGNDTDTTAFTIKNLGAGEDLVISAPVMGDPRFTLLSPSLPINIESGASQEFVIRADMSATTGAQVISTTLTLTTNDTSNPGPSIPLGVQILPGGQRILIDYDDGIANGIHESSVRNGGFEDGNSGDDFLATPFWSSHASPTGDNVQLTYDTDPAGGLKRGVASGWMGGPTSMPVQSFSLDDWPLEEGDSFTIGITWKDGAGFVEGDRLQVLVQVVNEAGAAVGDAANAEDLNANRMVSRTFDLITPGVYQTHVITSRKIQPGSPWIGNRPRIQILKTNSASGFIQIDNISLIGQLDVEPIRLSHYEYNPATKQVTLRWNDTGRAYKIQGTGDLDFSSGVTEIALDGSEDRITYPGEIQFQFVDPAAVGPAYFWRVSTD